MVEKALETSSPGDAWRGVIQARGHRCASRHLTREVPYEH